MADSASILGIPEAELTPRVRDAITRLMAEVDSLRQELRNSQRRLEELEELADMDGLLPLLNRRAFMRELTRIKSFADRYQVQAAMIYFDLDNFKQINDTFGHNAGDAVLSHVAMQLQEHVRTSDVVGRLGGDEFGVILAQADAKQALIKGEKLAKEISSKPFDWQGEQIPIELSHGGLCL